MKAHEIAVGQSFVGIVWRKDFTGLPYGKVPGDLISVTVILPSRDRDTARDIMKMFAGLPRDEDRQISSGVDAVWICGTREKRSRNVKVWEVMSPNRLPRQEDAS